jgi:predicted nucleic acid-binding protein
MLAEVGEALRRSVLRGNVSSDVATLAYGDLLELRLGLFAYEIVADRAWELRGNLTLYDAWYVALAEAVGTELATLDARLARAPGPRCGFVLPEPAGA